MKRIMLSAALSLAALVALSAQSFNDPEQWIPFDDKGNGGTSTIQKASAVETIDGKECLTVTMTGSVTTKYQYGFIGMEATPSPETLAFMKTATGIRFQAMGDGQKYRVKVSTSAVTDYDDFGYTFVAPAGKAATVTIPYKSLAQDGWGAKKKFDPTLITTVKFYTIGQPIKSVSLKVIALESYK